MCGRGLTNKQAPSAGRRSFRTFWSIKIPLEVASIFLARPSRMYLCSATRLSRPVACHARLPPVRPWEAVGHPHRPWRAVPIQSSRIGRRATYRTKRDTKPKFGYPFSWVAKLTPKTPSDIFRVEGPQSTDSSDCGPTRHVNQFHHAISQCWPNFGPSTFSRSTNLGSRAIFCRLSPFSFEFDYPLPLKSTALVMYRTQKPTQNLKHCFCLRPLAKRPGSTSTSANKHVFSASEKS